MIPKIIHYCWFTKDKNKELPEQVKRAIDSWKKILPDYEIKLWNEDTFDINSSQWVKECYEAGIASYAYATNYVKLWALYNYGGIYLDADQLVLKSLDSFLDNKVFVGMINPGEIGGGIIGAEKENLFIKKLLDEYTDDRHYTKKDGSIDFSNTLTKDIKKHMPKLSNDVDINQICNGLTVYAKEFFYPADEYNITENTYTVHLGLTSHYKKISVVLPVYNGSKYIREAIESVLMQTFKDFEFIIVDDGSTDNTETIVKSYLDDRLVYIKKEHAGISDALNMGIKRAIGIYIARLDADDRMYFDRLDWQYNWMEEHKDVDILGAGFEWGNGKDNTEYFKPADKYLTKQNFVNSNCVGHSTVFMRKKSIMSLPFMYESIYNGGEDQKLWITAVTHGLKMYNTSHVVNYYRQHDEQQTIKNYDNSSKATNMIKSAYSKTNDTSKSKLTVIIPFQNEIYEIEKTVTSIRATANDVKIMLIDDNSEDNYNYKEVADIFGCDYYRTDKNLGVAGARNFGVEHCTTPYFVLLDGHMRFYDYNWDDRLVKLLDERQDRLITSNTIVIGKDEFGIYDNENGKKGMMGACAAIVNLKESGWEFTAKWTYKAIEDKPDIVKVPCVLGAVYASSVEWWNKIDGLKGLIKYGLDEPLMSIKTWLAGGEVLLLKDWGVGHLYRSKFVYTVSSVQVDCNQLFLIRLFSPKDKVQTFEENLKKRVGESHFNNICKLYNEHLEENNGYMEYFNSIKIHDLDYFEELNNKAQ